MQMQDLHLHVHGGSHTSPTFITLRAVLGHMMCRLEGLATGLRVNQSVDFRGGGTSGAPRQVASAAEIEVPIRNFQCRHYDTSHKAWLIECNFGCVLFDPTIGQPLTTAGLVQYQRLYNVQGEDSVVNDHRMLADTVALMFDDNNEQSKETNKWEVVGTYQ
jgi:hypothetical protein